MFVVSPASVPTPRIVPVESKNDETKRESKDENIGINPWESIPEKLRLKATLEMLNPEKKLSGIVVMPRGILAKAVTAIPIMIAPGTCFMKRTAVRKIPTRAKRGLGEISEPMSKRLFSAVMRPELIRPVSVIKSPTPAQIAYLKGKGRASVILSLRGLSESKRNKIPDMKTRANASCHEKPYF